VRGGGARSLARSLWWGLVVVLVVVVLSVTLLHLAPGDPLSQVLDDAKVPSTARAQLEAQMGRGRPVPMQVLLWIAFAARGQLGFSPSAGMFVQDAVGHALPYSVLLGGVSLLAGFALGIGIALLQVRLAGRPADRWIGGAALALWALPEFLIALTLVQVLSVWLGWLPSGGVRDVLMGADASLGVRLWDRVRHLVLPATSLTLVIAAQVARHQRVALVEAWGEPFVRAARARGIREGALLLRHAWRAALAPTIALAGLTLPTLAGGAFIIERIYSWPGMGGLAFQALADRDPSLALGCVVLTSVLVVFGGVLADAVQARLDPRPPG
jgi:peptide/nickel transport system permease protein